MIICDGNHGLGAFFLWNGLGAYLGTRAKPGSEKIPTSSHAVII